MLDGTGGSLAVLGDSGVPYRSRTYEEESPTEMPHASLHAQFVPPVDLRPQLKMPRNDPCWCGSGKKWKRCHRDRESQTPVKLGEQLSRLYREFQKGYCSHPQASSENCGHRIVRAHTVQRRPVPKLGPFEIDHKSAA